MAGLQWKDGGGNGGWLAYEKVLIVIGHQDFVLTVVLINNCYMISVLFFNCYMISVLLLYSCYAVQPLVDAGANTEEDDADCAEGEGQFGGRVALESRQRRGGLLDVHLLHDEQIVVEARNGVDQCDEYNEVSPETTLLCSSHEDEELREHTCEGRDAGQREQGECHEK